eukprot:TRINITY_DN3519_c0_g3_i3.p1 TRINITY_DN3519_c0_g3~~TRINITY_DN3519_c0_g3_i3.p1  ORF type:complete len:632 (-),score=177.06 TRINITY_DN3519_c0_g3_i3:90-1985(-)
MVLNLELASSQKQEVKELTEKLASEAIKMEASKVQIEAKLSNIQPVLDAAKEAVGSIRSDNLAELKSLKTPPTAIRDVLAGVLSLMGFQDQSWNGMKTFLGGRGVKEQILAFDARRITPEIRARVEEILRIELFTSKKTHERHAHDLLSSSFLPLSFEMRTYLTFLLIFIASFLLATQGIQLKSEQKYTPDWKSLDSRPNPSWYDESKIGIFIHWGVFSVPSHSCKDGSAEWYWFNWKNYPNGCDAAWHNATYGPNFPYSKFAEGFTARLWNPDWWANLFKKSGAKYVVLTSKHHEGWCNFPSPQAWNWNSVDNGPGIDLAGELTKAVRKVGLKMGLYHSLYEWYHPLYIADKKNNYKTTRYVDEVLMPQLKTIVNNYSPSVVWADGEWEAKDSYWKSKEFLAWLYNESPSKEDVVINDRWGWGDRDKHGGFFTGSDRYNPSLLQTHKWENCFTIDSGSWGYNRDATLKNYLTIETILDTVVGGVAKNGNALINIGPTADGLILPIYEERLTQMGEWLSINGEGIYKSRPWIYQNDTSNSPNDPIPVKIWYTIVNNSTIYAYIMSWPLDSKVTLRYPTPRGNSGQVNLLGYDRPLDWIPGNSGIIVSLPLVPQSRIASKWAWGIKLVGFIA